MSDRLHFLREKERELKELFQELRESSKTQDFDKEYFKDIIKIIIFGAFLFGMVVFVCHM